MSRGDEFFIGWQDGGAPRLRARARATWMVLLVLAAALAGSLAVDQGPFPAAVFEFGEVRSFEGTLRERPVPLLEAERPGDGGTSLYPLVAGFKWGAAELVAGRDGRPVSLQGTLVFRDDRTMIEVVDESIRALDDATPLPAPRSVDLGPMTLSGEIVDSKCYLGVMNPGARKAHRACAVRCLSGGIPPVLRVEEVGGRVATLLLVDAAGGPLNAHVLHLVAEPVTVTGMVQRLGDQLVMRADPEDIERLAP